MVPGGRRSQAGLWLEADHPTCWVLSRPQLQRQLGPFLTWRTDAEIHPTPQACCEQKRREEARQSLSHGTNISVCKEDMTVTARSYKKCTAHMCTQNPQRTSSQRTEGVQDKGMETKRGPGEAAECPADFNSLSAAHWTSTVSVPPGTASVLPRTASVEAPRVGQHPVGRTLMFTGALKSLHVTTIHEEEFRVVADIRALKRYIALRLTQQSHRKLETLSE